MTTNQIFFFFQIGPHFIDISKIIYKINDYLMFIYWEADEMGQKNGGMALRSAAKQTA